MGTNFEDLERKASWIGRHVSKCLFAGEEFLLLIYRSEGGDIATVSSVDPEEQGSILRQHLRRLEEDA